MLAILRAMALLGLISLGSAAGAAAPDGGLQAVPPLARHVVDAAGLLKAGEAEQLDQRLMQFEQRQGSQIAVLVVPTTAPEAIEQYSIRVFDAWKLGRKQFNDGILILVATQDRKLRIDTGYGLEGAIPDAVAKRIIAETLAPRFRAGDAYGGLLAAVDQIEGLIKGEQLPGGAAQGGGGKAELPQWDQLLFILIVGVTIVGGVLSALLGRFFGSLATGGILGLIAWLMTASLFAAIGALVLGLLFVLITGGRVGSAGWGGGGWSSGGGSWGGSGGGGWGGGGGGSSGGGGASGSW